MLQRFRQTLVGMTVAGFAIGCLLISNGYLRFFRPSPLATDTLTVALYLLSALVQSFAAVLAVMIAVVFVTAQASMRPQYIRALTAIYRNQTTVAILLYLCTVIVLQIISLAAVSEIITKGKLWLIDLNILCGITGIAALLPLVLAQIENINPYSLAVKLSSLITPRAIGEYGLAKITKDLTRPTGIRCKLETWGLEHGHHDPLGWFHEVVLVGVNNNDRLLVSALIRLLLGRIARYAGEPFRRYSSRGKKRPVWLFQALEFAYRQTHRPAPLLERVAVTLHLLHYVIRRAHFLRKEWGDLDSIRKQFVVDLCDLIVVVNKKSGNEAIIDLCL